MMDRKGNERDEQKECNQISILDFCLADLACDICDSGTSRKLTNVFSLQSLCLFQNIFPKLDAFFDVALLKRLLEKHYSYFARLQLGIRDVVY